MPPRRPPTCVSSSMDASCWTTEIGRRDRHARAHGSDARAGVVLLDVLGELVAAGSASGSVAAAAAWTAGLGAEGSSSRGSGRGARRAPRRRARCGGARVCLGSGHGHVSCNRVGKRQHSLSIPIDTTRRHVPRAESPAPMRFPHIASQAAAAAQRRFASTGCRACALAFVLPDHRLSRHGVAVIIGTAGHIDHGKTSLVKALTGVDADRLKEEKERGITVDLGFAYKPLPDGDVLGFVDVPGHEKLVRNMLAGATGIDHVMLVVAADDGPMPQTREHLAILRPAGPGARRGGADQVRPASRRSGWPRRRPRCARLLAGTALADAPILPVSSVTGEGIAALLAAPATRRARRWRPRRAAGAVPPGGGPQLHAGRHRHGGHRHGGRRPGGGGRPADAVAARPGGARARHPCAEPRRPASGHAGQRLALNLAGVDKADVRRGDWVVADALHAPTQRLDARVQLLAGESQAAGALDAGAPAPGRRGRRRARGAAGRRSRRTRRAARWCSWSLDRPIGALHGDRFILRDQSALRTLGGGVVIDAFPPATPPAPRAAPGGAGGAGTGHAGRRAGRDAGAGAARRHRRQAASPRSGTCPTTERHAPARRVPHRAIGRRRPGAAVRPGPDRALRQRA